MILLSAGAIEASLYCSIHASFVVGDGGGDGCRPVRYFPGKGILQESYGGDEKRRRLHSMSEDNMEATEEVEEAQYWIYTGDAEVPDSVTHVRVSDDVTVPRARTFSRRERLVSVELNEGLVHVGGEAFYFCSSLEYVRFPSSVKTVGVKAFSECRKLNHVEFPEDSRGAMAIGRELLLIAGH